MGNGEDVDGALPSMRLLMKPLFNDSSKGSNGRLEPIAINTTLTLRVARQRFGPDTPLLSLPLMIAKTPSARYDDDNPIFASVDDGDFLRLEYRDDDPVEGPRLWYLDQYELEGKPATKETSVITVRFTAPYRKTDEKTLPGPRIDLRRDVTGGGLVGQGQGFIPVPPPPKAKSRSDGNQGREEKKELWQFIVEWDLAEAPSGIHGAWSFGDSAVSRTTGTMEWAVNHAIFAVGYLQRFPGWDVDTRAAQPGQESAFAMYWLDPSPYDMADLAQSTRQIHARIAAYFDGSTDPFRVFFRQVEANSGGTGASLSFLLEYSLPSVDQTDEHALADLLAHETVHEFALLDGTPQGQSPPEWQEEEGSWYDEGVASYVGALAGLNDPGRRDWLVKSMNNYAQAYYTSPVVSMPFGDVLSDYWGDVDITRVSYYRGVVYLAELDGMIWKGTQGKKSMDDVIVDLYRLRKDGEPCSLATLKEKVAALIGQDSLDRSYDAMFKGDLIIPSEDCLERYGLKLVKMEWHKFELGFDTQSMRDFEVRGLVPGSAADKAGVKEGDVIVKGFMVWGVEDELDIPMRLTVLRDGRERDLEWCARSDQVVEAYGWVDVLGSGSPDEL
ncbi:putative peptidase m61 domain-containing protein [Diaporthe ampelina]|uniref:Putative peptidase m61 domain-containing protein n=1 Tax=Diaporthe ampelina TaxID=1214573 RepID=A0A0G2FNM5_9PEZI|nr:putative peptidase m61 domain-containing protein [Diaporthe ampelina]